MTLAPTARCCIDRLNSPWGESYPELIVNDIGSYDGTTLLPDGSLVLKVSADGNWSIDTK